MARKIFQWENFTYEFMNAILYSDATPLKLKPNIGFKEGDEEFIIPYLNRICSYPDEYFVRKYRKEIEQYFLTESNHLLHIVKRLENMNYGGIISGSNEEMLEMLSQKRMTQTLCDIYLNELKLSGKVVYNDEESLFRVPKKLDVSTMEYENISLYPYQKDAVNAMKNYFLNEDKQSAILSMPTGSGKTRTSVYYLLHDMISQGYQVIWLCHRSMLIEQAAEQFYKFAPLIKDNNNSLKEFKMVCISGKHANVRALESDDHLIIASVQSLCNNTEYLPNILGEKVMIVVDEAHHTSAPSYRRIIKTIRQKRENAKLLGLTATPVRLTDKATGQLRKIFDNKIVYSITMSDLIANGTLSKPVYIPIETNVDIESIINIDEKSYIQKWGEFPESLIMKVAKTNERNNIIVDEYVRNKDKYGKTIIFALNAIHCDSLNEAFKKRGIRCGYVYTLINNAENQRTIDRFRHNEQEDGIDVLININILTEGSDIPDIQTVFLTRPTTSDVLLMQMIGRGMRGQGCGGTPTVNIVDFCDKWSSITNWMNPKFIFGSEVVDIENQETIYKKRTIDTMPMDQIRDIVHGITYKGIIENVSGEVSLPVGWYNVIDEDGNDTRTIVFDNQLEGYQKLKNDYMSYIEDANVAGKTILTRYFKTFGMLPSENDLDNIMRYIHEEKEYPELQKFEKRDQIDPYILAEKIKETDMKYFQTMKTIQNAYEQNKNIVIDLYGNFDAYKKRVMECLMFPHGVVPVGTRIEEVDKEVFQLSADPLDENIEDLLTEVMNEYRENLKEDFIRPSIYWTDRPVSSYFGEYFIDRDMIYVNSLLNSKSVPREVVKFIIYHECLHQEFYNHSKEFREKEHLFKDFQKQEYFLDYILRDFDWNYEY